MNWEDLQLLHAVSETANLSAAARRLGASQPTMSRRLRSLEERLGARLFDRLPNGLAPTPAGQRLLPLLADMGAAAEAISRAQAGLADEATGVVRLSVDEVVARFITDHLSELTAAAPGVCLEVLAQHEFANLSRREADLLIRSCLPDGPELVTRRLGGLAHAVYGARRYVDAVPAARTDDRYRRCDWITYAEYRLWFPAKKRWLDGRTGGRSRFATNQATVALDGVRAGMGLAVLPCVLADAAPEIVRLTEPVPDLFENLYLLIHRDILREPIVRQAIDALVAVFGRHHNCLEGDRRATAA